MRCHRSPLDGGNRADANTGELCQLSLRHLTGLARNLHTFAHAKQRVQEEDGNRLFALNRCHRNDWDQDCHSYGNDPGPTSLSRYSEEEQMYAAERG